VVCSFVIDTTAPAGSVTVRKAALLVAVPAAFVTTTDMEEPESPIEVEAIA
jgi:hypothetical protein